MSITSTDLVHSSPLLALVSFGLLALIVEAAGKDRPTLSYWIGMAGVATSLVLSFLHLDKGIPVFG